LCFGRFAGDVGDDFASRNAGARGGSHSSDRFVHVDKYVGLVDDFPGLVSTNLICRLQYDANTQIGRSGGNVGAKVQNLLSNQFFNDVFQSNDTDSTACLSGEFRD